MSELLNALRRNLAGMEEIGDEETAAVLRKRIAAEERAAAKADKAVEAEAEPEVDEPSKKTKKETT